MIRISKQLLFYPATIWISGLKCTEGNILEIINIFDCKWVLVIIDSLPNDSSLLTHFIDLGLEYYAKKITDNYVEISVIMPYYHFEDILKKAIDEDPENIFVLNLLTSINGIVHLQHSFEDLAARGITNVFVSVSFDEKVLSISLSRSPLRPKEIYRKIKALRFE